MLSGQLKTVLQGTKSSCFETLVGVKMKFATGRENSPH